MEGEQDEGRTHKENLRERFTVAANALTSLYTKSIKVEEEARVAGMKDAVSSIFEWALKRGNDGDPMSPNDVLDICRTLYTSYGGNVAELKGELNKTRSEESDVSTGVIEEEERQHCERTSRDSTVRTNRCSHCGTVTTSMRLGRKRARFSSDLDLEGDNELSQLFLSKLGSSGWYRGGNKFLKDSKDKDQDEHG